MRKKLCVFVIITLLFSSLGFVGLFNFTSHKVSGIDVSGPITSNTLWTTADAPFFITGDITIDNGANLTIQPGVDIYYNGSYSIRVQNGNLSAIGTKNSPISFVGSSGAPTFITVYNNNNAEFDWCEFVAGNEAFKLQNSFNYRISISNSSFFNCAIYFNLTNSRVNVTSTWFDSVQFDHSSNLSANLMRLRINDIFSELYIQYFVNIETVNGTDSPLKDVTVDIQDYPPHNYNMGRTDASGRFYFKPITSVRVNGTFPLAHYVYQTDITVYDKWDGTSNEVIGISRNYSLITNASTELKDANLYINRKFMFNYPPIITTSLSNVLVYEDVAKSKEFSYFDNDDYTYKFNNITFNITDENGKGIYGTNTKDKWISWTNITGERLVFLRTIESPWSPPAPSDYNAVVYEPIYITIMDDDGLKDKIGPVTVEFHNVPDKPEIDDIPAAAIPTEVTEDMPLYLPIVVSDDDNATEQIKVSTSSKYVTYNLDESFSNNQSLKLLYPNDYGIDGKTELVYVNATDGCWNEISNSFNKVSYSFLVSFHQTPDPPKIIGTIPNKYGTEVSWESDLSLGTFASDPDPDDDLDALKWYVTGLDKKLYGKKLFTVSNENATANAPLSFNLDSRIDLGGARKPRQITEEITIWLRDQYGLTDHQNIKLVVNSTNQPPSLHKIDQNGNKVTVVPEIGLTSDTYLFQVEYRDLDDEFGDAPEFVKVYIDGKPYNMTEEDPGDTVFKNGKVYVFEISNLSAGIHNHYFECSDTGVITRLPAISSEPNYIEGPQVESRIYIIKKKSPDNNFTVRFAHPSLEPLAVVIDAKKPGQELEPNRDNKNKTLGDIGTYFELQTGNIEYILWVEITIEFGPNYENYNTTWLRKDDMQLGYFLKSNNEWVKLSFSNMDTDSKILSCNLSQFTGQKELLKEMVNSSNIPIFTVIGILDADGDNVFNQRDAFPFDPAASIDSDSDGSPDRWHPGMSQKHSTTGLHLDAFRNDPAASVDDDKDGCADSWNPGKSRLDSTSVPPLNLDSYPGNPGACLDTDGDGLPDQLIPDKNTQPNLVEDTDDDNDGLPDWWEDEWYQYAIDNNLTHFFNSKNDSDADEDWDGDGWKNKKEYQENTNPFKKDKGITTDDVDFNVYYIIIPLVIVAIILVILFLYTKMRRDQLLEHKVRAQILDHINDNPGIHYRKILNDLELQMGVATHHLNMLERQKYIKSFQDSNYRRFYPISAPIKTGLILSNVQERILKLIRDNPGVSQSELARRLNLARKVVNYHIKILSDANFVNMETEGRQSQLFYLDGLEFKKAPPRRKRSKYKDT